MFDAVLEHSVKLSRIIWKQELQFLCEIIKYTLGILNKNQSWFLFSVNVEVDNVNIQGSVAL